MKNLKLFSAVMAFLSLVSMNIKAQNDQGNSKFNAGFDIYSNYVWRGSNYGTGPAFQPSFSFSAGGLTIGMWGSFDAAGYKEADPYLFYELPFGLSLGITDYYYPGLSVFEFSDSTGSHSLELNAGYSIGGLGFSANYILNEAGGAGSAGGDKYFEVSYDFENFGFFLGAGDGWHTSDGEFKICNIGIGTSKEIVISESFSLPLSGQVILNPDQEQLYLVVGISF